MVQSNRCAAVNHALSTTVFRADPENGGSLFFQNIGTYLLNDLVIPQKTISLKATTMKTLNLLLLLFIDSYLHISILQQQKLPTTEP
jgi:hypothetical protein